MFNMFGQQQFNRSSNKIPVNSLEDALSRYTDFNSNIVYWDVNKNVIYDVYTDGRGNKTYDVINISKAVEVNKSDVNEINYDERLKIIETKLEDLYGKYNAQQQSRIVSTTVATDTNSAS